jgi:hypothetical protein
MRSLHNPAASWMPLAPVVVELLFANLTDVRVVVRGSKRGAAGWVVVRFIQAKVLWIAVGRLGSVHHDRLDGLRQEFRVVHIGPGQHDSQWAAIDFDD